MVRPSQLVATLAAAGRNQNVRRVELAWGAAIAALASDPNVRAKSGGVFTTPALAREYGFTDVDGKQQSAFWDEHWAGTRD